MLVGSFMCLTLQLTSKVRLLLPSLSQAGLPLPAGSAGGVGPVYGGLHSGWSTAE